MDITNLLIANINDSVYNFEVSVGYSIFPKIDTNHPLETSPKLLYQTSTPRKRHPKSVPASSHVSNCVESHAFPSRLPSPFISSTPSIPPPNTLSNIQNSKVTLFSFLSHPPIFPQAPEQVDPSDLFRLGDNSSSLACAVSRSRAIGDVTSRLRNLDEQTLKGIFLLVDLVVSFLVLGMLAKI